MMPKTSIIILNWNGEKDTLECLNSLKKLDYKGCDITVVDNCSTDGSAETIKKQFQLIKLIKNPKNLGWAGGNNIGIKYALENKAEYVLLLNNDTVVDEKFLSEMIKIAQSDKKIGIISSKSYFYSSPNVLQYATLRFNFKKGRSILEGYGQEDKGQFDTPQEINFCGGACILVKREVFEKIGLLDEDYFMYFDDTDFGTRAIKAGYKIIFCPKAKIWHKVSASSRGQNNLFKDHLMSRNRIIFMKKHANKGQFYRFLAYLFLESAIAFLTFIKKGKFDVLKSTIKGILEGIKWKK